MNRLAIALLMIAGWNLLPPASVAAVTGTPPVEPGSVVALLPVQNRAGDPKTAADLEQILRFEISRTAQVLEPGGIRSILRQRRVRSIDSLTPESLQALADELEADWILSVTLHGSDARQIPWLTVSARAYRGSDGEMAWAGFGGGSGMDKPGPLQTGVITDMAVLIPRVVRQLTAGLLRDPEARVRTEIPPAPLGSKKVAVFPFEGLQSRDATVAAETVTECARATAYELGLSPVSPGCIARALRSQRQSTWGGVGKEARAALWKSCGADSILTGAVELYTVENGSMGPEPKVALAIRLLDAESGQILWSGSAEREGWDSEGLFQVGRVYSQADLTRSMMEKLARRLVKERSRKPVGIGEGRE